MWTDANLNNTRFMEMASYKSQHGLFTSDRAVLIKLEIVMSEID